MCQMNLYVVFKKVTGGQMPILSIDIKSDGGRIQEIMSAEFCMVFSSITFTIIITYYTGIYCANCEAICKTEQHIAG